MLLRVRHVVVGGEGAITDNSLYAKFEDEIRALAGNGYILADMGFPLRPWLMTPFREAPYHFQEFDRMERGNSKHMYNRAHSQLRNVVERFNGKIKRMFRILRVMLENNWNTVKLLVLASTFLYNFILDEERRYEYQSEQDVYYYGDEGIGADEEKVAQDDNNEMAMIEVDDGNYQPYIDGHDMGVVRRALIESSIMNIQ